MRCEFLPQGEVCVLDVCLFFMFVATINTSVSTAADFLLYYPLCFGPPAAVVVGGREGKSMYVVSGSGCR